MTVDVSGFFGANLGVVSSRRTSTEARLPSTLLSVPKTIAISNGIGRLGRWCRFNEEIVF